MQIVYIMKKYKINIQYGDNNALVTYNMTNNTFEKYIVNKKEDKNNKDNEKIMRMKI